MGAIFRLVKEARPSLWDVFAGSAASASERSLGEVWRAYGDDRAAGATPFLAAARVASQTDRLGFGFAVGYPAALERMVPGIGLPCALCITEAEGNHPRAIQTTLRRVHDHYLLDGTKSFVTFGTMAAELLVLARAGEKPDGLPDLAMVRIPARRRGIELRELPPTPFAPEVPHARLVLRAVEVSETERLPGDGYLDYAKPFRTIEDVHVLGAAIGYLIGVAHRCRAQGSLVAKLAAALTALDRLSSEPALDSGVHLALHGAYQLIGETTESAELEAFWRSAPADERARWERDKALLRVASKAREARFQRACEQLALV